MRKMKFFAVAALAGSAAMSQDTMTARAAYQQQQALAEVPRLVQQFEVLANNQEAIVGRLSRLESSDGGAADLRQEIAAVRAELAEIKASIRRDQDAMRREIVADLAKRIAAMQPPAPPPAPAYQRPEARPAASSTRSAPPPPPPYNGPCYEHVVEKGQTLSFIAKGFDTTVAKIMAANPGLKPDNVRVGQKLIIPAEDVPQAGQKKKKGR